MSITYSEISSLLSEAKKKKPLTTGDCDAPKVDDSIAKITEGELIEFVGGKPGDGYIGHPNLDIKNPLAKKQTKEPTGNQGLAGKLGDRKMRMDAMMKQLNQSVELEGETIEEKSAAWQRKEGKNKKGGLNEKGRKSYERENPGSDLKAPQPEGGPRKRSFCARMGGMKGAMKKPNGEPTRKALALRKWKC